MTQNMQKQAQVRLPGCVVGRLTQDRDGTTRWNPAASWQRTQMPRLGFDFLRSSEPRTAHHDLPTWFENLLPERESALRSRLAAHFGLREGQSFALLIALGEELPGAVRVGSEKAQLADLPEGAEPPTEEDRQPSSDQDAGLRPSSLAGMQLKCSMSMVNQRLTFGARKGASEWIIQFPGEFAELAEVEDATLSWASLAGFEVPPHRTVPFDDLLGLPAGWAEPTPSVFAIERFDRRADGTRIHHEDMCQALGLRPSQKYGEASPGVRYEGVMRFVHDACGETASREFARRLGFAIASGNTDAHLKNWGLLWGDRVRPELTPCYDQVCTIAWDKLGWQRKGGPRLALRFGTTHRFADLDDDALARFSAGAGQTWVADEIRAGIAMARDAFRALSATPQRMVDALDQHWHRVPILRRLGPLPRPDGAP